MKLDTTHLRYLTPEDWRVLTAVEIGSKNHEVIPTSLIIQISNLRSGSGAHKSISTLAKANLIARVKNAKCNSTPFPKLLLSIRQNLTDVQSLDDGYRLTYGGLDYLSLHTHFQRRTLHSTGPCIGTGKESDIHIVLAPPPSADPKKNASKGKSPAPRQQGSTNRQQCILKIHRLGRISFRTIKTNRDYLRHRHSGNWMYMSRLSAQKEFTFMTALHNLGFPVPTPIAWNRHTVVMSLIEGTPLYQVRHLEAGEARALYAELMAMIVRLADVGLIHGDFNEFNIMIEERETQEHTSPNLSPPPPPPLEERQTALQNTDESEADTPTRTKVTLHPILIDFPQMLSTSHQNASTYFARDVNCIKTYFQRRFHFTSDDPGPFFSDVEKRMKKNKGSGSGRRLDVEVEASGFSKKMAKELEKYMDEVGVEDAGDGDKRRSGNGGDEDDGSDDDDDLDGDSRQSGRENDGSEDRPGQRILTGEDQKNATCLPGGDESMLQCSKITKLEIAAG
ncbi:MAG: hypothetical protein Q9183_002413 [Haloplaca sp. 2 TL-2023]